MQKAHWCRACRAQLGDGCDWAVNRQERGSDSERGLAMRGLVSCLGILVPVEVWTSFEFY